MSVCAFFYDKCIDYMEKIRQCGFRSFGDVGKKYIATLIRRVFRKKQHINVTCSLEVKLSRNFAQAGIELSKFYMPSTTYILYLSKKELLWSKRKIYVRIGKYVICENINGTQILQNPKFQPTLQINLLR